MVHRGPSENAVRPCSRLLSNGVIMSHSLEARTSILGLHELNKIRHPLPHAHNAALSMKTHCLSVSPSYRPEYPDVVWRTSSLKRERTTLRKLNKGDTYVRRGRMKREDGGVREKMELYHQPAGPYSSAKPLEEKPCFIYSAAYPWKPERSLQARPVFHPYSRE